MLCLNTSSLQLLRFANQWQMLDLLKQVAETGVAGVIIQGNLYPERAMYWTRMSRDNAAKLGLTVIAIQREADLGQLNQERVEEHLTDLKEWIRIAALSDIPYVRIELIGLKPDCWQSTVAALKELAAQAALYGNRIILAGGRVATPDDLFYLAKEVGFSSLRLSWPQPQADSAVLPWIIEYTAAKAAASACQDCLVTIQPEQVVCTLQELRTLAAGLSK